MSDNETGISPKAPEIIDPHKVATSFVDWVVTFGQFEGVVNLTLGTTDHAFVKKSEDLADIVVSHRLRMSLQMAERLHNVLGNILGKDDGDSEDPSKRLPPNNTPMH